MRALFLSLLVVVPALVSATTPSNGSILNGCYHLNGEGSILDATSLGSSTGYFLESGELRITDITLQNFTTTGGAGSGGGAGLGGALFINSGTTATINNVTFNANTAIGGAGGLGAYGGVLNGLFNPSSNGNTGVNGDNAPAGAGAENSGNGRQGYSGTPGGAADHGFGGVGGSGGIGGPGTATTATTAQLNAALSAESTQSHFDSNLANGFNTIATTLTDGGAAVIATSFLITEAPTASAVGGVLLALASEFSSLASDVSSQAESADSAVIAYQTAYLTAVGTTSYETDGVSGNGGAGGNGANGGAGSFGFGGGPGGNGGNGGDAVAASIASGGAGGNGGTGGQGGFGGGGGLGGSAGLGGANGTYATVNNGYLIGSAGSGGISGFGAGMGSIGNGSENGMMGSGGSGYGGAIFVAAGGTLNINGTTTFNNNNVEGGSSLNGGVAGGLAGSDLFMMKGSTVNLDPGYCNVITFNGTIADDSVMSIASAPNATGQGANLGVYSGTVAFNGANTYTGQTGIFGGVLQARDGVGINTFSNINLSGGVLETEGLFHRFLGTGGNRVQFTNSGGFSARGCDLRVTLNNNETLTVGQGSFLPVGESLIFGSRTATHDVTFTNDINMADSTLGILAQANHCNSNKVYMTGVLSNGALSVNNCEHNGDVYLTRENTYTGATTVRNGRLFIESTSASQNITVDSGATLIDVHGGLYSGVSLTVNGTVNIDANQEIGMLYGSGTVNMDPSILTVSSGDFSGSITGSDPGDGLTKVSCGTLTLSGDSTYIGTTQINEGRLELTGSLASETVNVSRWGHLSDHNGGLSCHAALTNAGVVDIGSDDRVASLVNCGTINGCSTTLTAETYHLNDGSVINANLGTGSLTSNGSVAINGTTDAHCITIETGTTTLGSCDRLIDTPNVSIEGSLVLGGHETIDALHGCGELSLQHGSITINEGWFGGEIIGTDTCHGLTKESCGTLTLAGENTYLGATHINEGRLNLTGSLESEVVHVSHCARLEDANGGLSSDAALINAGTIYLCADDTVASLVNCGTIDGCGNTLTAATYQLNNGSVINTNLGAGTMTTTGTVDLNGTSQAAIVIVSADSTLNLGGPQLLLQTGTVTLDGTINLNGGPQTLQTLIGSGVVNTNSYNFIVNNGGEFNGQINGSGSDLSNEAGLLNLINTLLTAADIHINNGSVINISGGDGTATADNINISNEGQLNLSSNGVLNSIGTITVNDSGVLTVLSGAHLSTTGDLIVFNDGAVTIANNSSLSADLITLSGNSTMTVPDSSTLTYVVLTGDGFVETEGSIFFNHGIVTGFLTFSHDLTNLGTLNPGSSPGITVVVGSFVNSGVLTMDLAGTGGVAGTDFSHVRVGGTATINPGSTLDVESFLGFQPSLGNTFQIISNSVGGPIPIIGTFTNVTYDTNTNAAVVFDVATGQLITTGLNAPTSTFADLGTSRSEGNAAAAIFNAAQIASNQINTGSIQGFLAAQILTNTNAPLERYTPKYYGAMADFAFDGDRALIRNVWNRVSLFYDQPGDCRSGWSAFVGTVQSGVKTMDHARDYRQDYFVGLDYSTTEDISLGIVFSENTGEIHSQLGHGDVDGSTGLVYARGAIADHFTLFGAFSYSWEKNKLYRSTVNGNVEGSNKARAWTANVGLEYKDWKVGSLSIAPLVNLVYSDASVKGFSENGAIDALHNSGFDAHMFSGELGVSVLYSTNLCGREFDIEVVGGVEHTFQNRKDDLNVYVIDSPDIDYSVIFAHGNKTFGTCGVNLGYNIWNSASLFAGYEGVGGEGWSSYFTAGLRIAF